ncbi:MAG: hypothetical protein EOO20_09085 [Chryseobacterium sp.]|nr:MAG: hypothetical protein EOO20_09085 [Chryseobacterium sp.]
MDKKNTEKIDKALMSLLEKVNRQNPDSYNYIIPKLFSKKLSSFMLIREDLIFVKNATEKLIEHRNAGDVDEVTNSALWYSVLAIYGKCFTENKARMSKLDPEDCFTKGSNLEKTHDRLIHLRHSFVAHRDDTEFEQAIVFMKLPKKGKIQGQTEFKISSQKILSPKAEGLQKYIDVFDFLIEEVEKKIDKHGQKTHDALLKHLTPKEIGHLLIPDADIE